MTTLLNGLLGGLVIGTLAAVITRFVAEDPSISASLLMGITGVDRGTPWWLRLVPQLAYGSFAGGLIVAFELLVLQAIGIPPSTSEALGLAVFGSALLVGVLTVILRITMSRDWLLAHLSELIWYHVIYGLGLGLWIRVTWIT